MIYFMPICDASQMERQYQAWLPCLPSERKEKLLRYRFAKDRWLCAAAYMLLLHGLQEEYGLAADQMIMDIADSGKPYLSSHPHIHFSLSHCDAGAACAISTAPVGIDAETIREIDDHVVRHAFSLDEQAMMARAENPSRTGITMWTLKESWLKAVGCGLNYPMNQVAVTERSHGCYCVCKADYTAKTVYSSNSVVVSVCAAVPSIQDHRIAVLQPSDVLAGRK